MSVVSSRHLDRFALAIGLGGVLLGVLVAICGRLLGHNFVMHGIAVFAAAQVTAIVLGVITRDSPLGRTAMIASSILLIGSFLLLVSTI